METLKTIIIDDEQKGRNLLNELVKRYCPEVEVLGLSESTTEAILKIRQLKPPVVVSVFTDNRTPFVSEDTDNNRNSKYLKNGEMWDLIEKTTKYLTSIERKQFEIFVKNGKIVNSSGDIFDTGGSILNIFGTVSKSDRAIFVMSKKGEIFISKLQEAGKFHHSSFLAGDDVAAVGEMIIENGLIKTITNKSGHYKPDFDLVKSNVTKELKSRGLSTEKINFVADE